jgi:hypothetical protein
MCQRGTLLLHESDNKIYQLKTLCRSQEQSLKSKDLLIRNLQREKASLFADVTKLRARTPVNSEAVADLRSGRLG